MARHLLLSINSIRHVPALARREPLWRCVAPPLKSEQTRCGHGMLGP